MNRELLRSCFGDLDPESWQRIAGEIAYSNFTRDEWRQYFPGEPYRATFPDLPDPSEITTNSQRPQEKKGAD